LKSLLQKEWTLEAFDQSYFEIIEVVESLPISFKSKADRL
jgi:hypothetical protein